jgi:membrane-bound lytic murein transglycosylase D
MSSHNFLTTKISSMFKKTVLLFSVLILIIKGRAQEVTDSSKIVTAKPIIVMPDDPVMAQLDKLSMLPYFDNSTFTTDVKCLNIYGFSADQIPEYSDEVYRKRIEELDAKTPLNLVFNSNVKAYINVYGVRKREQTARVLGLAEMYFPLIEEKLDQFDIPLEMKYLAIVESALNPNATSRVGAQGLWQFMYGTGKEYGLEVDSYKDERCDPIEATIAACRYLKHLHKMYNDWDLALAAYNSGPGNVNKAIRRSGGKKNYWAIINHLPQETRGYVPAFIAVNYIMSYNKEHNIYPVKPLISYFETDTVLISGKYTFEQLSKYLSIPVADIVSLNPVYKENLLPGISSNQSLRLPKEKVGLFLANQDSILYNSKQFSEEPQYFADSKKMPVTKTGYVTHSVKKGDSLGKIANKYSVSVAQLKSWNKLKTNTVVKGQKIKVKKETTTYESIAKTETKIDSITSDSSAIATIEKTNASKKEVAKPVAKKKVIPTDNSEYIFHTVQPGDTLWSIANKYDGVTIDKLKKLNKNLNTTKLKPGQKIKVQIT